MKLECYNIAKKSVFDVFDDTLISNHQRSVQTRCDQILGTVVESDDKWNKHAVHTKQWRGPG